MRLLLRAFREYSFLMDELQHLRDRRDRLKLRIQLMETGDLKSKQLMPIDADWTPIRLDEAKRALAAVERQIARRENLAGEI